MEACVEASYNEYRSLRLRAILIMLAVVLFTVESKGNDPCVFDRSNMANVCKQSPALSMTSVSSEAASDLFRDMGWVSQLTLISQANDDIAGKIGFRGYVPEGQP